MSYHRVRAEKGQVTSYQQTTVIGVTAPCGKPWHYTANQLAPVDVIVLRTSCAQGVQLKDATSRNSFFQLVCINEATCLPTFMLSCFFSLGFRCTSFILLFYSSVRFLHLSRGQHNASPSSEASLARFIVMEIKKEVSP